MNKGILLHNDQRTEGVEGQAADTACAFLQAGMTEWICCAPTFGRNLTELQGSNSPWQVQWELANSLHEQLSKNPYQHTHLRESCSRVSLLSRNDI